MAYKLHPVPLLDLLSKLLHALKCLSPMALLTGSGSPNTIPDNLGHPTHVPVLTAWEIDEEKATCQLGCMV